MKLKKILLIAVAVVIVVVLGAFAFMGAIIFDVNSNLAGGSETLSPAGNVTGHALVVYNPAILGAAKNMASTIAGDLQAQGYSVVLAGIKSSAAADTSGYDVIVVGGPIYAGNASGSIASYLKSLTPPANVKIGVFATGTNAINIGNPAGLKKEVTSLPDDSPLKIKAVTKVLDKDDVKQKCSAFVAELLQ